MKDYSKMKSSKKWSVSKKKVVSSPAISEVKDENGVIVREKQDEISYDDIKLIKKQFDSNTGLAIDDIEQSIDESVCDSEIKALDNQITELTAQKEGWELLKADIAKL